MAAWIKVPDANTPQRTNALAKDIISSIGSEELASQTGLPKKHLTHALGSNRNPTVNILGNIFLALKLDSRFTIATEP